MDTILVAVDLTDNAAPVLEAAVAQARHLDAKLDVMHVVHHLDGVYGAYVGGGSMRDLQNEVGEQARKALTELVDDRLADAGVEVEATLLEGVPWSEIVGRAVGQRARLLVIGAHVFQKPEHRVLGSTAERVLRQAPCPVLVIPPSLPA